MDRRSRTAHTSCCSARPRATVDLMDAIVAARRPARRRRELRPRGAPPQGPVAARLRRRRELDGLPRAAGGWRASWARRSTSPARDSSRPTALRGNGEDRLMSHETSDALVFFGATGDLAYKKIFPALPGAGQARAPRHSGHRGREGRLDARSADGSGPRQRRRHGGLDPDAFARCAAAFAISTAITVIRGRSKACGESSATRTTRRTISRSPRLSSRPFSISSARRVARRGGASSSRSPSVTTWPRHVP